jgi:hypothetical protein
MNLCIVRKNLSVYLIRRHRNHRLIKASQCKMHQKQEKKLMVRSFIQKVVAFNVIMFKAMNRNLRKTKKNVRNMC